MSLGGNQDPNEVPILLLGREGGFCERDIHRTFFENKIDKNSFEDDRGLGDGLVIVPILNLCILTKDLSFTK